MSENVAYIHVSAAMLGDLLGLPEGHRVKSPYLEDEARGIVSLMVEGPGIPAMKPERGIPVARFVMSSTGTCKACGQQTGRNMKISVRK